jgi:large subunit ribosomal protein L24e
VKVFRFIGSKEASLFHLRKNPRKIHWTTVFRRIHKKGITEEVAKKRTRKVVKHQRAIFGTTLEALKAKKNQSPQVRAAQRDAAIQAAKDKKKEKKKAAAATRPAAATQQKVKPTKQPKQKVARRF